MATDTAISTVQQLIIQPAQAETAARAVWGGQLVNCTQCMHTCSLAWADEPKHWMKASSTGNRASRARVTAAGSSTYLHGSSFYQPKQVEHLLELAQVVLPLKRTPAQLMSSMQG